MSSKKVTIFRAGSFLAKAQTGLEDFFALSTVSIGSYWESIGTKRIGTGLSFEEETILLPLVLDVPAEDREFRKSVSKFYMEMDTKVPYLSGITLEIGLKIDNDKPLSLDLKNPEKSNLPIQIMDYLRYRHALRHPYVAQSKDKADGNGIIQFYIFDKSAVLEKSRKTMDVLDLAIGNYAKIKEDADKVKKMLTLMGTDYRIFDNASDMVIGLRKIVEAKPDEFNEVYKDSEIESKYTIQLMCNFGVLKQIGDKYQDVETKRFIANSKDELISIMADETQSDLVLTLKTRLQESLKKPYTGKTVKF